VAPAEERANHPVVNAPFSEEHLKDPVAEEMLQGIDVDLRKRNEPARSGRLTLDDIIAPR
jgi:hypothetical protein